MPRTRKISARFSAGEKKLLARVAACLRRTQSDTLRILIVEKAVALQLIPDDKETNDDVESTETNS